MCTACLYFIHVTACVATWCQDNRYLTFYWWRCLYYLELYDIRGNSSNKKCAQFKGFDSIAVIPLMVKQNNESWVILLTVMNRNIDTQRWKSIKFVMNRVPYLSSRLRIVFTVSSRIISENVCVYSGQSAHRETLLFPLASRSSLQQHSAM